MKAVLEYNLPEDREDFEIATKAGKTLCRVEEFGDWLRGIIEYTEKEKWPDAEAIRDKFWEIMNDD